MGDEMESIIKQQVELNEQILFIKNEGMFVGRIVEVREKAIKVDYCWESIWGNGAVNVFTYTTWIPKSAVIHDNHGGLTVKSWFINAGLCADKIFHIKKYFISPSGEKVLL